LSARGHTVDLPRGLARITPYVEPPVDAADVAVTLLTGGRPDLLAATVAALQRCAYRLSDSAHVTVLHNHTAGTDQATEALLDSYGWIDVHRHYSGPAMLPVGAAVSQLTATLPANRAYWLHLEDDWTACTVWPHWLADARAAL